MTAPAFDGSQPCQTVDPEVFFPSTTAGEEQAALSLQATVCGRCPFRAECLEYAIEAREEGVWAGTTTKQRAAMARARGDRVRTQSARRAERDAVIERLHRRGLDSDTIHARTGFPMWEISRARRRIRAFDGQVAS